MMDKVEIKVLEGYVDELLETVARLEQENVTLREQQSELLNERGQLIQKTEKARARVEAIITRLKSMEKEA